MKRLLPVLALVANAPFAHAQPVPSRAGGIRAPGANPTWSIGDDGSATFKALAGDASSATAGGVSLSDIGAKAAAAAPTSALAAYAKTIGAALTGASLDSTSTIGGVPVSTLLLEISAGSSGGVSGVAAITGGSIGPSVTVSGTPLSTVLGQASAALPANDAGLAAAESKAGTALQPGAIGATVAAQNDSRITGALPAAQVGAASGVAPLDSGKLLPVANLPAVPAANLPIGSIAGTVAAGNDSRITGALSASDVGLATAESKAGTALQPGAIGTTIAAQNDSRITGALPASQVGAASGVAPLDSNKLLPAANLPVGTVAGTVAAGNDSRIAGALPANDAGLTAAESKAGTALQPAAIGTTVAAQNDSRITGALPAAQVGAASGVAPLDSSKLLPVANLPAVPVANLPVGTIAGTVAAGNDSRITGALPANDSGLATAEARAAAALPANSPALAQAVTQAAAALPTAKVGTVGGASPLNSCAVRPSRAYAGAIIGAADLATAGNVPNLQGSHNVGFYLTSYALTQVSGLSVAAIQSNWTSQATGIIEVGTDPVVMPDIAANYGSYVTSSNGYTWGGTKGSTWPSLISAGGWAPKIAMLNEFLLGTTNSLSDPYYLMDLAAIADVKKAAPSIQYVLPYLTANAAPVTAANADTDWTSAYWGESRAIAMAGGGLGVDTPSNYFNVIREPGFRALTAQEIKWATANGLLSVVLLSPYDLGAAAGTTPQFQYDPTFMEATQQEVAYLHGQGADPTFYVVTNYSEGAGTNSISTDTTPESVGAVALWVARNAPTSPMPAGVTTGLQAEASTPCAPELIANRSSQRLLLSDIDGPGGMASQNPNSVNIGGGSVGGLNSLSALSNAPVTLGSDGGAPVQMVSDGNGNVSLRDTNSAVTPNYNLGANVNLTGGQSLTLNSTSAHPFSFHADGVGNVTMGDNLGTGNVSLADNFNLTGTQSLSLASGAAYPFRMSSDGVGNVSMLDALATGNLKLNLNILITGSQSLVLNSTGAHPASLFADGLGSMTINPGAPGGVVTALGNWTIPALAVQQLVFDPNGSYPSSTTVPCTPGQMAWQVGAFAICTATNSWQSVILAASPTTGGGSTPVATTTSPAPDVQSVAAYTVPPADCNGTPINMTNASGATVTIPSGLTSGCHFQVAQAGSAGPIAITAGTSMTLPAGSSGTVYVAGVGQHTDVLVIGSEISVN